MKLELMTSFSFKVTSLVTGIGVDCLSDSDSFYSFYLPINLFPAYSGITAVDRLYPLKPKNPI